MVFVIILVVALDWLSFCFGLSVFFVGDGVISAFSPGPSFNWVFLSWFGSWYISK